MQLHVFGYTTFLNQSKRWKATFELYGSAGARLC